MSIEVEVAVYTTLITTQNINIHMIVKLVISLLGFKYLN